MATSAPFSSEEFEFLKRRVQSVALGTLRVDMVDSKLHFSIPGTKETFSSFEEASDFLEAVKFRKRETILPTSKGGMVTTGSSARPSGWYRSDAFQGMVDEMHRLHPDDNLSMVREVYGLDTTDGLGFFQKQYMREGTAYGLPLIDAGDAKATVMRLFRGEKELTHSEVLDLLKESVGLQFDDEAGAGVYKRLNALFSIRGHSSFDMLKPGKVDPFKVAVYDPTQASGPMGDVVRKLLATPGMSEKEIARTMNIASEGMSFITPEGMGVVRDSLIREADRLEGTITGMSKRDIDVGRSASRMREEADKLTRAIEGGKGGERFNFRVTGMEINTPWGDIVDEDMQKRLGKAFTMGGEIGLSKGDVVAIGAKNLESVVGDQKGVHFITSAQNITTEMGMTKARFVYLDEHKMRRQVFLDPQTSASLAEGFDTNELAKHFHRSNMEFMDAILEDPFSTKHGAGLKKALADMMSETMVPEEADILSRMHFLEQQQYARQITDMIDSGLNMQDYGYLLKRFFKGYEASLTKTKNGHLMPRFALPDTMAMAMSPAEHMKRLGGFGRLKDLADGEIDILRSGTDEGSLLMNSRTQAELFEAFGGHDFDDYLNAMLRWDTESERFKVVAFRQPNSLGEYAILDPSQNFLKEYTKDRPGMRPFLEERSAVLSNIRGAESQLSSHRTALEGHNLDAYATAERERHVRAAERQLEYYNDRLARLRESIDFTADPSNSAVRQYQKRYKTLETQIISLERDLADLRTKPIEASESLLKRFNTKHRLIEKQIADTERDLVHLRAKIPVLEKQMYEAADVAGKKFSTITPSNLPGSLYARGRIPNKEHAVDSRINYLEAVENKSKLLFSDAELAAKQAEATLLAEGRLGRYTNARMVIDDWVQQNKGKEFERAKFHALRAEDSIDMSVNFAKGKIIKLAGGKNFDSLDQVTEKMWDEVGYAVTQARLAGADTGLDPFMLETRAASESAREHLTAGVKRAYEEAGQDASAVNYETIALDRSHPKAVQARRADAYKAWLEDFHKSYLDAIDMKVTGPDFIKKVSYTKKEKQAAAEYLQHYRDLMETHLSTTISEGVGSGEVDDIMSWLHASPESEAFDKVHADSLRYLTENHFETKIIDGKRVKVAGDEVHNVLGAAFQSIQESGNSSFLSHALFQKGGPGTTVGDLTTRSLLHAKQRAGETINARGAEILSRTISEADVVAGVGHGSGIHVPKRPLERLMDIVPRKTEWADITFDTIKGLFGKPSVRNGAIIGGGIIAASLLYGKAKDRTYEDMSGPPLLPGGSAYEGYPGAYVENNSVWQGPSSGGVTYKVNARGSFNPDLLTDQMSTVVPDSTISGHVRQEQNNRLSAMDFMTSRFGI